MNRLPFLTALFGFLFLLSGCAEEEQELYTFKEPHMGTEFTLRVWAKQGQVKDLTLLSRTIFDRIAELNQSFSDYLPESEINNLARAPVGEPFSVSQDLYQILDLAKVLSEQTEGAFDVTSGPLIRLWRLSRKNRSLPTPEQLGRAHSRTGSDLLELDPLNRTVTKRAEGMLFDLGGIAKGYAADEALKMLREAGFSRALVAASGDIVVGDPPPGKEGWIIGIETLDIGKDLGDLQTVALTNRAISTSGDTRRYFELDGVRYSHIVSTKTGLGLTERIGASVIAPNATTSDSFATAVTLLGEKDGLQFIENKREIECQIVALRDGQEVVIRSDGFTQFQEQEAEEKGPLPRRDGREAAVQYLYGNDIQSEVDFSPEKLEEFWELRQAKSFARDFATTLVFGVRDYQSKIDSAIRQTLENFAFQRLTPVDRNILRVGVYEILFSDHIPPEAAINESIEIAKRYGSEESPAFVNGILDKIHKSRSENPTED